jgi:hypothetical protein
MKISVNWLVIQCQKYETYSLVHLKDGSATSLSLLKETDTIPNPFLVPQKHDRHPLLTLLIALSARLIGGGVGLCVGRRIERFARLNLGETSRI